MKGVSGWLGESHNQGQHFRTPAAAPGLDAFHLMIIVKIGTSFLQKDK